MAFERFRLVTFALDMTTGVSVALTAGNIQTSHLVIQADIANINSVYIGSSAVSANDGIEVVPGLSLRLSAEQSRGSDLILFLQDIYVLGTTGDKVRVGYYESFAT